MSGMFFWDTVYNNAFKSPRIKNSEVDFSCNVLCACVCNI